jgi:hypothetical protein
MPIQFNASPEAPEKETVIGEPGAILPVSVDSEGEVDESEESISTVKAT